MTTYKQIIENNKKWVAEKKATDKEFFEKLAEGQDLDFLYIGCSDSSHAAAGSGDPEPMVEEYPGYIPLS